MKNYKQLFLIICLISSYVSWAIETTGDFPDSPQNDDRVIHDNGSNYSFNSSTKSWVRDSEYEITIDDTAWKIPSTATVINDITYFYPAAKKLYSSLLPEKKECNIELQSLDGKMPFNGMLPSDRLLANGLPEKFFGYYKNDDTSHFIDFTFSNLDYSNSPPKAIYLNKGRFDTSGWSFYGISTSNPNPTRDIRDLFNLRNTYYAANKTLYKVNDGVIQEYSTPNMSFSRNFFVDQLHENNEEFYLSCSTLSTSNISIEEWENISFTAYKIKTNPDQTISFPYNKTFSEKFQGINIIRNPVTPVFLAGSSDGSGSLFVFDSDINDFIKYPLNSESTYSTLNITYPTVSNTSSADQKWLIKYNSINNGRQFPKLLYSHSQRMFLFSGKQLAYQIENVEPERSIKSSPTETYLKLGVGSRLSYGRKVIEPYKFYKHSAEVWTEITEDEYNNAPFSELITDSINQHYKVKVEAGGAHPDLSPTMSSLSSKERWIYYTPTGMFNYCFLENNTTGYTPFIQWQAQGENWETIVNERITYPRIPEPIGSHTAYRYYSKLYANASSYDLSPSINISPYGKLGENNIYSITLRHLFTDGSSGYNVFATDSQIFFKNTFSQDNLLTNFSAPNPATSPLWSFYSRTRKGMENYMILKPNGYNHVPAAHYGSYKCIYTNLDGSPEAVSFSGNISSSCFSNSYQGYTNDSFLVLLGQGVAFYSKYIGKIIEKDFSQIEGEIDISQMSIKAVAATLDPHVFYLYFTHDDQTFRIEVECSENEVRQISYLKINGSLISARLYIDPLSGRKEELLRIDNPSSTYEYIYYVNDIDRVFKLPIASKSDLYLNHKPLGFESSVYKVPYNTVISLTNGYNFLISPFQKINDNDTHYTYNAQTKSYIKLAVPLPINPVDQVSQENLNSESRIYNSATRSWYKKRRSAE